MAPKSSMLRGSSTSSRDSDPIAQHSKLDPVTTGGQKSTCLNNLKRALGISSGNLKSHIPSDLKELKRFNAPLREASARASFGSKCLDEYVHKLKKYWEVVDSKNQFQNERLPNERMSGSHLSQLGSQTHQSTTELANQKPEDKPKKMIPNNHIGTSAVEIQAEGQNNSFGRQPLAIGNNIQRLPASGETRDRKMKRKHSMGTIFAGSADEEGEPKRVRHVKQVNESGLQSCDAIGLRFDDHGKNYIFGIYPNTRAKASRASRTGNLIVGNSSSETLDAREQPSNVNQPHLVIGAINHKHPFPIEPSTSQLGQWVWERPLKRSRTRRANGVSPLVINCDEMPMPFESCSPSSGTIMTSTIEEKSKILTLTKQTGNMKPSSLKNASRSRPPRPPRMKKSHNIKAIAHLGHPSSSSSPDIAGRLADDCEELLFAANFASNASYTGCSSSFWKKMEPIFTHVNLEVIDHLKQQDKTIEDDQSCLSQMLCLQSDAPEGVVLTSNLFSQNLLDGERGGNILNQSDSKELSSMVDMVDQHHDGSFLSSQIDLEYKLPPLYQRVLSALIVDDQTEETVGDENISFLHERDDDLPVEFYTDTVPCNGHATCDEMSMDDKLLLELKLCDVHPELLPQLADGGFEAIDQEIIQLQKGNCQQLIKKKEGFMKLIQAVEDGRELEQRALEQVAMDKLVELAYKKKLATRGTLAAKYGISKTSRPVALAYMKRTLARCRTFEETKKSCFLDPMFKDVLFATPALDNYTVSTVADNRPLAQNSQQDFAPPGSFPCREQNVLGNSDHPSNLDFARTEPILNGGKICKVLADDVGASASLGGKKGEVLLDDIGASASLEGKKEKVLLDGIGASASLGGKKGEVLLDDVGASSSLGGKKGEELLDDVSASASLGGKKGEVLLDKVGTSAFMGGKKGEVLPEEGGASASLIPTSTPGNSFLGGTTGKRSKRGTNKDTGRRNYVKRGGRSSASNTRSEHKTKAKAKPKADLLSTSAKESLGKLVENTNSEHQLARGSDKSNVGSVSHGYCTNNGFAAETEDPLDLTNMPELDNIEVDAAKDLDSWLDIGVDALEDDDDAVGLDIPMDDLFTIM